MFGPTTGDRVRLADTDLFIEVERDLSAESGGYSNEVKLILDVGLAGELMLRSQEHTPHRQEDLLGTTRPAHGG